MKDQGYKGIILAGGTGSRLFPITKGVTKSLLPIYDKPMIYFPLSTLMLVEIRDVLIITMPDAIDFFVRLLGDGSRFGLNIEYAEQPEPKGLADAFLVGKDFIGDSPAALILGDNIFHGAGLTNMLSEGIRRSDESFAMIFGYYVNDPERYGVAEFDKDGKCISLEEKPKKPKSNYAVPGLYFYPNDVVEKVKGMKPSARGELEITTLNQLYLKEKKLEVKVLPRGFAWLDTGTFGSLAEAANYIETIEKRQGLQVACLEEIAYKKGWITKEKLMESADMYKNNEYGKYLLKVSEE